jgi:hypothetical protein
LLLRAREKERLKREKESDAKGVFAPERSDPPPPGNGRRRRRDRTRFVEDADVLPGWLAGCRRLVCGDRTRREEPG